MLDPEALAAGGVSFHALDLVGRHPGRAADEDGPDQTVSNGLMSGGRCEVKGRAVWVTVKARRQSSSIMARSSKMDKPLHFTASAASCARPEKWGQSGA